MNISIKEVTKKHLAEYSQIPMLLQVTSEYRLKKVNGGLGGIVFEEVKVQEYEKI